MRQVLIAFALAACSNGKTIAITELRDKYVAAWCANQVTCQQMPDLATCEAATRYDDNAFATKVAEVKAKSIVYDAEAAARWIDYVASLSCDTTYVTDPNDPSSQVFSGTVAVGGACLVSEQCSGVGSTCSPADPSCNASISCCPGTCTPGPTKQPLGGTCGATIDCAASLYCSDSMSRCTQIVTAEGATCEGFDACAPPLFCNYDPGTQTGTCYTPPPTNATCDPMMALPCADERDYCDPSSLKCTRDAPVNAACSQNIYCVAYADCMNGNCVARPKAGETCMGGGPTCLGDLQCSSAMTGSCTLAPAGTSCQ